MIIGSFGWTGFAALASAAAALGTLVLAWVTSRLARSTTTVASQTADLAHATRETTLETRRSVELAEKELAQVVRQVDAAERQAAAAQQTLSSAYQPLLVPVVDRPARREDATLVGDDGIGIGGQQVGADAKLWRSGPDLWAVVPVRNVGPGVAIFPPVGAAGIRSYVDGKMQTSGRPTSRIVATGDIVDVVFHARHGETGQSLSGEVTAAGDVVDARVVLTYQDVAGRVTSSSFVYSKHTGVTLNAAELNFQFRD